MTGRLLQATMDNTSEGIAVDAKELVLEKIIDKLKEKPVEVVVPIPEQNTRYK